MKLLSRLIALTVLVTGISFSAFAQDKEAAPAVAPAALPASAPVPAVPTEIKGLRVFSCGHSFHPYVPDMLAEFAKSAGIKEHVIVGKSIIGGSKSIQHWNVKDADNKAKEALNAGKVDVLTLTPIYLPDDGIEKFAQLGFEKNPNFRETVQEFWLPYDVYNPILYDSKYKPQPGEPALTPKPNPVDHNAAKVEDLRKMHEYYFKTMDEHITALNNKFGKQVIFVVPVGQAVIALREKIIAGQAPGLKVQEELFTDQLGHPKVPLQVLVTYCHFAVIYGKSPVGLPVPGIFVKAKTPNAEELNRLLQELAWDAVTSHPLSGVKK